LSSAGSVDSEIIEERKKEKISDLKKKEKDLEDKLAKKMEELKNVCMREAVSLLPWTRSLLSVHR
jgi:hypothetical protein